MAPLQERLLPALVQRQVPSRGPRLRLPTTGGACLCHRRCVSLYSQDCQSAVLVKTAGVFPFELMVVRFRINKTLRRRPVILTLADSRSVCAAGARHRRCTRIRNTATKCTSRAINTTTSPCPSILLTTLSWCACGGLSDPSCSEKFMFVACVINRKVSQ